MLALADFSNDQGESKAGIKRIAKKARVSERTCQRIMAKLEIAGFLKVRRHEGLPTKTGNTNLYQIVLKRCHGDTGCHDDTGVRKSPGDKKAGFEPARGDTAMSPNPSVRERQYKESADALAPEGAQHTQSLFSEAEKTKPKSKRFEPPSIEEIRVYFSELKLPESESQRFLDHHQAAGWQLSGRRPMKDWKAAARTWRGNYHRFKNNSAGKTAASDRPAKRYQTVE